MPEEQRSIFISYRREDAAGFAGRLKENLAEEFPYAKVFMDIDGIPYGEDFARYIDQSIAKSDVLVALIGRRWVEATASDGSRRLDDPRDFVRLEVEAALKGSVRVIPVLVDGAKMPRSDELPESLRPLLQRHAIELDNERWDYDVGRLKRSIANILEESEYHPPRLEVSSNDLDFAQVPAGAPWPRKTVQIRNVGGGELKARCSTEESWIVLRQHENLLDVLIDTTRAGDYVGQIRVQSEGGRQSITVRTRITEQQESPRRQWGPESGRDTWTRSVGGDPTPPRINSYLAASVTAALLCCLPTGIVGIVYASQVKGKLGVGDVAAAMRYSRNARTWTIVSVVAGVILYALAFMFGVFGALTDPYAY